MNEQIAHRDMQRLRLEAMLRRTLDTLRGTIQLRPREGAVIAMPASPGGFLDVEPDDAIVVDFTDDSARVIAPLVEKADMLGALEPKHLAALRTVILDYIGKSGHIEEFHRVIQQDTVTIEELMLLVFATADHAEFIERR